MRRFIGFFIFFTCIFGLKAERVNTIAEVYAEPGQQTIAQLYKGSGIYVVEKNKDWAKIIAVVVATKTGYNEYTLELPKKTVLYDMVGQETGRVYGKLKLPAAYRYEEENVVFELAGYIRTTDIDTNWIVEQGVIRIIDSAQSIVTLTDLQGELERFRFFKQVDDTSGFEAWQMDDIPGLNYKNPIQRLKLVFFEKRLVAVFHKNPFKLKTREAILVGGRENLIYLRDLSTAEKKQFARLFLN